MNKPSSTRVLQTNRRAWSSKRLKERYFLAFPDGRERLSWPGLIYVRANPKWIRFSNFAQSPAEIVEFSF